MWWLTNSETANGQILNSAGPVYGLYHAISQRSCAELRDFYLSFNGSQVPTYPISTSVAGKTTVTDRIFGANAYSHLEQCFNETSSINNGGILDYVVYCDNRHTRASDVNVKKFIGAICTERGSMEGDKYFAGYNSISQNVNLHVNWDAALASNHHLYVMGMYDIVDGLMVPRF